MVPLSFSIKSANVFLFLRREGKVWRIVFCRAKEKRPICIFEVSRKTNFYFMKSHKTPC